METLKKERKLKYEIYEVEKPYTTEELNIRKDKLYMKETQKKNKQSISTGGNDRTKDKYKNKT